VGGADIASAETPEAERPARRRPWSTHAAAWLASPLLITVVAALLLYFAVAFFLRPLRPPAPKAAPLAASAALLLAVAATVGAWIFNPYLAVLVALGLQAWVAAAATERGRLAASGLVLLGLLPLVALVVHLAGRFDAGIGVWQDLLLMLANGQIGAGLALLGCLLGGCGVALVAAAGGRASRPDPDLQMDGEISVHRGPEPPARTAEPEPEPDEAPANGEAPERPEPAQPEPERDPRLWSNPLGSSCPPPGSLRATPRPSVA